MTSQPIRINVLGRFEVIRGEQILTANDWSRRKAATLLQLVALKHRLIKDQVIEILWPDTLPESGLNNLYQTLHILRQTLDRYLGAESAENTLTFEGGIITLDESVWVDAEEFQQIGNNSQSSEDDLERALDLYIGDLLTDNLYDEWTLPHREALQHQHRQITLQVAGIYQQTGDYQKAISLLTPLLMRDRTDEAAHIELMRLYALDGHRHQALRQYQRCVEALQADLDVLPGPTTEALYAQIVSGAFPGSILPVSFPEIRLNSREASSIPLVGREQELAAIYSIISSPDSGRTILLTGDAGVGKTRLADEVLRKAATSGMTPLFGSAYEQEGQLAYQPFVEAFDRYLAGQSRAPTMNPITHYTPIGSSDPQQEQSALFREIASFLMNLAQSNPVMLILDDLHAADEASLRLFHYLARQTQSAPVILMATYRHDVVDTQVSPCSTLLNALYREHLGETYLLSPLQDEDVGKIMAHVLDGEVAPTLVNAVAELTEGNPFFIQEITYALLKFEEIDNQGGQWHLLPGVKPHLPAGLRGLIRERIARLGPTVEPILRTAAVIGRQFGFVVLRAVSALEDDRVLDALDAALAGQILDEVEHGYRFRHQLIRQALYEGLSRARRTHLHTQIARELEAASDYTFENGAMQVEALAYHYDLSNHRERAIPYLLQAGEKAAHLYAFEVAVDYFEQALNLMEILDIENPARRWQILEHLGWWGVDSGGHTSRSRTL